MMTKETGFSGKNRVLDDEVDIMGMEQEE